MLDIVLKKLRINSILIICQRKVWIKENQSIGLTY